MGKIGGGTRSSNAGTENKTVAVQRSPKPGGSTLTDATPNVGVSKPGGTTLVQASSVAAGAASAQSEGGGATVEPATVTITYGPNADKSTVAASPETIIKELVAKAGDNSCTITSTARSPEDQARAMYNNLESKGVEDQKALYGAAGDKVIDVYSESKAAAKNAEQIKADMVKKINELGPSTVSNHCADPTKLCVVDIAPSSITHKTEFIDAVEKDQRVSKFLKPPADPAYHLEIPV